MSLKNYRIFFGLAAAALFISLLGIYTFKSSSYSNPSEASEENKLTITEEEKNGLNTEKTAVDPSITGITSSEEESLPDYHSANIRMGGKLTADENFLYFSNFNNEPGIYKCRPSGTAMQKISNLSPSGIIPFGNKLYYFYGEKLRSSLKTGGDEKILYDNPCSSLTIYKSRLYFYDQGAGNMVSMNMEGDNLQVVIDIEKNEFGVAGFMGFLQIKEGILYYTYSKPSGKDYECYLTAYDLNSKASRNLYKGPLFMVTQIDGSFIYFNKESNTAARSIIQRIDVGSGKMETIKLNINGYFLNYIADGNSIYYLENTSIYKYSIKEKKSQLISNVYNKNKVPFINPLYKIEDRLFMQGFENGYGVSAEKAYIYTIKTDGTEEKVIY
ncbi:DUF5050 domain-containing protein [Clostridium polynesiense]|uniref:DUF5050 domain-containing protein n=1 Tax=Clostridium polynesiense TaxID=1325933 RepID=UPI00058DCFDB|nr:DUF5050 domain-containing protein [Clostridium polynesiense]